MKTGRSRKYYLMEAVLILFNILINLIIFAVPLAVNQIINGKLALTDRVIAFIIGFMLLEICIQFVYLLIELHMQKEYKKNLSKEIYQKIYSMKYASIIKYGATYLTERADSTVLTLANLYIMSVPILTAKSLVILLILLYSLTINSFIFLVMLFILILNVAGFYLLNKNLLKKSAEMQRIIPKERKDIYQIANQVDFIKQNEDNTNLNDILEKHLEIIEQENKRVNVYARGMSEVIDFFNMFAQNIILIVVFYMYLQGNTKLNSIFTISILMSYLLPAISNIVKVNLNLREVKASREFLQLVEDEQEQSGDIKIDHIDDVAVDMEKLQTMDGILLAKDIHIQAKKGDIIGIVGESGCGKTTLMKSILKFWDQNTGIKINGIPLENIENHSFRKQMSFYLQNVPIITGSIYDNLNFGRRKMEPEVYQNIRFLDKFTKERDIFTPFILENGNNLSGGDKQRIALARMYTEEAEVLILDEPTSSLDETTEKDILDGISHYPDKIIFLITHRKENLRYCNKIYRIRDKRMVSVKNVDELSK